MKKVGLATCFLDNYGACLQAYALSESIKGLGYDCEIINYTEPTGYFPNTFSQKIKESHSYNYLRGLLQTGYKSSYKLEKIRRPAFRNFRDKNLSIGQKEYKTYSLLEKEQAEYDIYVCGSDQVWNPTFYNKCNPAYYLSFVPDEIPKIAYAPSIGISDIPEEYRTEFKKYVNRFDYVSVREQKGVELVEKYAQKEAKLVVDPTLLFASERWEKVLREPTIDKPYLFCYLFGASEEYQETIKYIAEKKNLDIVIIPFNEWNTDSRYKQVYTADPFDFISLIKHAEYVFTDSFHASVFSILFEKDFHTVLRHKSGDPAGMNSRIFNLLSICDLEDRCISIGKPTDFEISSIKTYKNTKEKIKAIREESLSFLQRALEGK